MPRKSTISGKVLATSAITGRTVLVKKPPSPSIFASFGSIVSPYFTRQHAPEIAIAGLVNLGLPILSSIINDHYSTKSSEEYCDGEKQSFDTGAIILALTPVIGIALRLATNNLLAKSLKHSIAKDITIRCLEQPENLSILKDHLPKLNNGRTPSVVSIITSDIPTFSGAAIPCSIGMFGNFLDFVAMYYTACNLVGAEAALTAFGLSAGTALAVLKVNDFSNDTRAFEQKSIQDINGRLNHVEANYRQIGALKGSSSELADILGQISKQESSKSKASIVELLATSIGMGAFFAFPGILRTAIPELYPVGTTSKDIENFSAQAVHSMAALKSLVDPFQTRVTSLASMDHISTLLAALDEIKEFKQDCPLKIKHKPSDSLVEFSNFSLVTPDKELFTKSSLKERVAIFFERKNMRTIDEVSLKLKPGIYRLCGDSGTGKSSLLKAMDGSWPFAYGDVSFPCKAEEVYFMPQDTFTPHKASLLEVMTYPRDITGLDLKQQDDLVKNVTDLMKHLGLEKHLGALKDTEDKKDWSSLSPGEKQRVAVIRMLVADPQPKVLLMDEATSSIDKENRDKVHALIKEKLKDSTIIYIDHSVEAFPDFCDSRIEIDKFSKKLNVLRPQEFVNKDQRSQLDGIKSQAHHNLGSNWARQVTDRVSSTGRSFEIA